MRTGHREDDREGGQRGGRHDGLGAELAPGQPYRPWFPQGLIAMGGGLAQIGQDQVFQAGLMGGEQTR